MYQLWYRALIFFTDTDPVGTEFFLIKESFLLGFFREFNLFGSSTPDFTDFNLLFNDEWKMVIRLENNFSNTIMSIKFTVATESGELLNTVHCTLYRIEEG